MAENEERRLLRGAVARGDGLALTEQLQTHPWPADALQLIGDGLVSALQQQVEAAPVLARECLSALRDRGWSGDAELADALAAELSPGAAGVLRPLAVDLEELAMVLEGDPVHGGGRIDLRTGEVWPQPAIEYAEESGELDEDEDDPGRWLWVECAGSGAGYRDMEQFISTIEDPEVADRLSIAITGRGAFRRFKDVLSRWPDLMTRWHGHAEDRQRGRARAWLAEEGYSASAPASLDS